MKRFLTFLFTVLLAMSANAQLDRGSAARLVSAKYPVVIEKEIKLVQFAFGVDMFIDSRSGKYHPNVQAQIDDMRKRFEGMAAMGFVLIREVPTKRQLFSQIVGNVRFELIPQAGLKQFIVRSTPDAIVVRVGQVDFGKITGIRDLGSGTVVAEFETTVTLNSLAPFVTIHEHERRGGSHSAQFVKYDDGWRLSR